MQIISINHQQRIRSMWARASRFTADGSQLIGWFSCSLQPTGRRDGGNIQINYNFIINWINNSISLHRWKKKKIQNMKLMVYEYRHHCPGLILKVYNAYYNSSKVHCYLLYNWQDAGWVLKVMQRWLLNNVNTGTTIVTLFVRSEGKEVEHSTPPTHNESWFSILRTGFLRISCSTMGFLTCILNV